MRSRESRWEIFGFEVAIGVCLSVVVFTAPGWGESLDNAPPPAHRWSNDKHIGETVTSDGCGTKVAPGYRAEYKAGVDASGRAVAPAQSTQDWQVTSLEVSAGGSGDAESAPETDPHRRHKRHRPHEDETSDEAPQDVQAFATLEQGKDQDCSSSFK